MNPPRPPHHPQGRLTAYFWSGDVIRSRTVSRRVLTGTVNLPALPSRLIADWNREVATRVVLEPGDVEELPLARARTRWPEYRQCVQAMSDWAGSRGLPEVLTASEVALMACRGARYHHDGAQYGGAAFCNLFVSDDRGLDLHFPVSGHRIPLTRGTAVIFDTGQPHGVILRGSSGFQEADFPPGQDYTQMFLTWELPIEDPAVGLALDITFDPDPLTALNIEEELLWWNGAPAILCPESGAWLAD